MLNRDDEYDPILEYTWKFVFYTTVITSSICLYLNYSSYINIS